MGSIVTQFASVYRDYITDGVPASGPHDPVKSEIRAIGATIENALGTLSLGSVSVTKDTRAHLNADLAHAADTVALVYADATDANNDIYVKVGSSGSGSWTLTGILHLAIGGLAQPYVDDAQAAAAAAAAAAAGLTPPLKSDKLTNAFNAVPSRYMLADGTIPMTFAQNFQFMLPASVVAAIVASASIEIVVPIAPGSVTPTATTLTQQNAANSNVGSTITLTSEAVGLVYRGTLNAACVALTLQSNTSGTVIFYAPSVAVVAGIRPTLDNRYLAQIGYAEDAADAVKPLWIDPFFDPTTPASFATTGGFTIPVSSSNFAAKFFVPNYNPATNTKITLLFYCASLLLRDNQPFQGFGLAYNNGNAGPAAGHVAPVIESMGNGWYTITDYVDPPSGGYFSGFNFTCLNNSTTVAYPIQHIQMFEGVILPTHLSEAALTTGNRGAAIQAETALNTFVRRCWIFSDSSKDERYGVAALPSYRGMGYYMALLGGARLRVVNMAAQGANTENFLALADILPITADVVGGALPADTGTAFQITNWSHAPITSYEKGNPDDLKQGSIYGVDFAFTPDCVYGGGSTGVQPTTLYARRLTAGLALTVPNGSRLTLRQGRSSAKDFVFVSTGSRNGAYGTNDADSYNAFYSARCTGRTSDEIAKVLARTAFCPSMDGTPGGTVPGTHNTGSTAAVAALTGAGCPSGSILDVNAPQGALGTGTGGGSNREFLSAAEKTFLQLIGYTLPTGGSTNDLQQKMGYRSDDLATADNYHPNKYQAALMAWRHYNFAGLQAHLNNPD